MAGVAKVISTALDVLVTLLPLVVSSWEQQVQTQESFNKGFLKVRFVAPGRFPSHCRSSLDTRVVR